MSNIQALITTIQPTFGDAKIGGKNSYLNASYQTPFKLAWITVHKALMGLPEGFTVGDDTYTAKVSKDGRPYLNCLNKSVSELALDDVTKALMEEYDNAVKGADEKAQAYKESRVDANSDF